MIDRWIGRFFGDFLCCCVMNLITSVSTRRVTLRHSICSESRISDINTCLILIQLGLPTNDLQAINSKANFNVSLITISAVVKRDLQLEKVNYAVVSVTSAQTLKFSEIEGNVAF